ncbi:MAG: hypothetical protein H6Q04_2450 [Acidobacteria bacterium]|nr:hypothetical protein [Acidobacteriota bacterium]
MAEYSIEFGKELIEAAQAIVDQGEDSEDAGRAILYLSLLACEIILKALLEKAGRPISEMRKLSHDLSRLLDKLGLCEVEEAIANRLMRWIPATGIRGKVIVPNTTLTVGVLLEGERHGASRYPNEIRYGERIYHFPPVAALRGATILLDWAYEKWDRIR